MTGQTGHLPKNYGGANMKKGNVVQKKQELSPEAYALLGAAGVLGPLERRKTPRLVGVNERGLRVGEDHHRAKLTNEDVELIWSLMEEADEDKKAGRKYLKDCEIAEKFEISKAHVHNLRHGKERAQSAVRFKKILEEVEP